MENRNVNNGDIQATDLMWPVYWKGYSEYCKERGLDPNGLGSKVVAYRLANNGNGHTQGSAEFNAHAVNYFIIKGTPRPTNKWRAIGATLFDNARATHR